MTTTGETMRAIDEDWKEIDQAADVLNVAALLAERDALAVQLAVAKQKIERCAAKLPSIVGAPAALSLELSVEALLNMLARDADAHRADRDKLVNRLSELRDRISTYEARASVCPCVCGHTILAHDGRHAQRGVCMACNSGGSDPCPGFRPSPQSATEHQAIELVTTTGSYVARDAVRFPAHEKKNG